MLWLQHLLLIQCLIGLLSYASKKVEVYHFISKAWGSQEYKSGDQVCGIPCHWTILDKLNHASNSVRSGDNNESIQLSLYNIHSWYDATKRTKPDRCQLPPLSIAESEESQTRFGPRIFQKTFPNFDGFSTTSPASHIPRIYKIASNFSKADLLPEFPYKDLIQGASYVAGDCHEKDKYANSDRDKVVLKLRELGYRVDGLGLGKCMHHIGEGGAVIPQSVGDRQADYEQKKQAISKYLFHLAFENTLEPGYVSEKPFHALIAGTVPVYLGDAVQLKRLLPHPKAAICVSDFPNLSHLVQYLRYLSHNETAYEEHRSWRQTFDAEANRRENSLLSTSWQCAVCQWATAHAYKYANVSRETFCDAELRSSSSSSSSSRSGKDLRELAPAQIYALIFLLLVFLVVITRMAVKLWCPQWLRLTPASRNL